MAYDELIRIFSQFGLAFLLGVLIGLERELRDGGGSALGLRDFVLFSLIGALSTFLTEHYDTTWIFALGFVGVLSVVVSGYWADRGHGPGITTELAAIVAEIPEERKTA